MAIADLNVRIGAIYKDFDRDLRNVERSMTRFSGRMGQLGTDMTASLTLPLIAFGAKAVSAAGDAEALRLAMEATMKGAGASIAQANQELEALRKAALAPGLDLQQAVQGSIRLQSAKQSASQAREELVQLANAIATTGGAAPQLDAVTKQFSQMLAKGRILQEDLGIIQENMPLISQAMEKAFGTTSATKLQEMGVSAQQFINGITEQLAQLPRVEGGLKNSLTNAGDAITQFFAGVGEDIAKTLDLKNGAQQLSDTLADLASYWRLLDSDTKKTILTYGLYLAAAGPIIKISATMVSGTAALVNSFRGLTGTLANMSGGLLSAVDKFKKMDTAMKLTSIGALIAVVGGLYLAFNSLSSSLEKAQKVYTTLKDVEKEANDSIRAQKVQVDLLIGTLNEENATRDDKVKAINKLKEISPGYFGQLTLEDGKVKGLRDSYDQYVASILRSARAKAAEAKLIKNDEEREVLEERLAVYKKIEEQEKQNGVNSKLTQGILKQAQDDLNLNIRVQDALVQKIKENSKETEAEAKAAAASAAAADKAAVAKANLAAATAAASAKTKKSAKEEKDAFDIYLDTIQKAEEAKRKAEAVANALGIGVLQNLPQAQPEVATISQGPADLTGLLDVVQSSVSVVPTVVDPATAAMEELRASLQNVGLAWTQTDLSGTTALANLTSGMTAMVESFSKDGAAQVAIFDAVQGSIIDLTNSGSTNMKDFARAAAASAIKVAKAYAVQGIFAATSKALAGLPFPINLIGAAAAAATAGALLNGLANRIQPPALAAGGIAYGRTTAIVGEYGGAGANPEVIAPLNTLTGIIGESGRTIDVRVHGEISGRVIKMIYEKEVNASKRGG